jgi:uncharacterized OB-fold protein
MPRAHDDPSHDEGPSADDIERFSDATVTCPGCGTTLHDDVDLCYKCGRALGAEDEIRMPSKGTMIVALIVILGITGALGYFMHWF